MRIIFAGTPEFAAKHLQALLDAKMDVVAVYTQPDRPAGRGKKPQASEVKKLAQAHQLPVCQPANFKQSASVDELAAWQADIMVVVAYGIILPRVVLDTPKHGCINVHGSILPKWRGAAPIQRSIWAGDKQTGVTIMQMDEGLDTGPMLLVSKIDISAEDTSASLYAKLAECGPTALVDSLEKYSTLVPENQNNDEATYAKKLSKEEACIDWQLDAEQLERNCRAFNPWPVQWFKVNDTAVKVWSCHFVKTTSKKSPGTVISADKDGIVIACKNGALCLTRLQVPGKKPMAVADILNSKADWFAPGAQF